MNFYLLSGSWCNPCTIMKEHLKEIIGKNLEVISIGSKEYDEAVNNTPEIMSIVSIPTIIATHQGEIIDSHSGVMTLEETKQWIIIQEDWLENNK